MASKNSPTIFFALVCSITLLGLISCKKKGSGQLMHKLRCTSSVNSFRVMGGNSDTIHSGYGDYITSITPKHLSTKISMMFYTDNWDWNSNNQHAVSYTYNGSKELIVDFSKNQEVALDPQLFSKDIVTGDGESKVFKQKEVTFTYFVYVPWYIYQEVELPIQYKNIRLSQFDEYYKEWLSPGYGGTQYNCDSVKSGTLLKTKYAPFISRLFDGEVVNNFIFGNTDSTFVFNREKKPLDPSKDWPFGGSGNKSMAIRSDKFKATTVAMPVEGQTMVMSSTVLFNADNLIQIYAGKDNIPYTSDDILLYAPKFWERMKAKLEIINQ